MKKLITYIFIASLTAVGLTRLMDSNNESEDLIADYPTFEEIRLELEADLSETLFMFPDNFKPFNEIMSAHLDSSEGHLFLLIYGRCSALAISNLRLDEPNANQKFDDMSYFIGLVAEYIDPYSPSEYEISKGHKAIMVHEYFLNMYRILEGDNSFAADRAVCKDLRTNFEKL